MLICKRFFGVLSCFFFLLLAPINNDSQAACGSDPNADSVKIAGYAYTSTSIQDAYNYASTTLNLPSFTLQLAGQIFTEDLLLDGGAVVLDGGYDCSFVTKTSPSSVFGTIIIRNGSLNVAAGTVSPKVVSTDQTTFDRDGDGFTSIGSTSGSADDCNDNVFAINPGAVEICDGLDNNCDGQTDEGLTGTDADGDGYYAEGSCAAIADDCNDNDAGINPGVLDIPYDGINQDCSQDGDLTFNNGDACVPCHSQDNLLDFAHSWRPTATDDTCVLCHAGPVNRILSGHYGKTVRTTDNNVAAGSTINCWTCHDNNNHSGGPIAGAFGDGLGDVWNDVAPPYPDSYTCDNCHANRSTRHATATAHNNRVIDSTCANCHTSPSSGTLASAADVDALHRVALPTDCVLCHAYSGTLLDASVVRQTISQGLSGTQVSCLNCHTDKGTNHGNFAHPIEVGPNDLSYNPGQLCSACHVVANWAEIEGTEHNVATNGAGSCATCHDSTRPEVMAAITAAANPTHCLDCHADKELTVHGNVDHVALDYVTRGASFCLDCHDPGTAANATVDITHNGTCSLCHTTIPALQPGVPAGGGDCLACHIDYPNPGTNDWYSLHVTNPPDHNALVTTTGTDNCASCHADAMIDVTTHLSDCSNCHNASDGSLMSLAIGQTFTPGGNCETCHTDGWEATHTTNTPDHGILVRVDATSCGDCHNDPPPLVDADDPQVHDGCGTCHNANGSSRSLAIGPTLTVGGDCTTCHTTGFDTIHATSHTHTVAQGAGDLSYDPPGTPCSDCHVVSTWAEIEGTEHNVATNGAGSCSTCHNSSRQEVIDAITTGADPTNCLACHGNKNLTVHGGIDHVASGDVSLATACADCHDPGGTANATVDITHAANCTLCHTNVPTLQEGVPAGPADCATCHPATWETTHTSNTPSHTSLVQVSTTDCASCHDDTLVSGTADTHDGCSSCHNPDGSLTSYAIGQDFTTGGDCSSCHGTDWGGLHITTPDHSSLVTTSGTNCGNCHADALIDVSTHLSDCSNCHNTSDGSLVLTLGTDTQTFAGGGNCLTCHTGRDWTDHNIDHQTAGYVTLHSECTSCHATTLTAGADFINPADDEKHNACTSCHAADGAIATGSVDCSACHSGETTDWTTHAQDHTTLVTQQTECSSCHTATVEYANFVDPANNVKHDNCYVCHDNTTKLASAAAGDCTQCHTANYFDSHTHSHDVSYNPSTDTSQSTQQGCATCHDDNGGALASWTDIYVEHLGNCATCHSYTDDGFGTPLQPTVETTIASGTAVTCATCHTPKVPATDHGVDHIASSYVTGEAACLVCHIDPATTFTDPANAKIHDDCTTCHDSGTNALIGSAFGNEGGPNTCTTCHTGRDWTDHNIDHQTAGYVTLHSECTSCHATTLTAGADFINPADDEKHNACTSCHATDGAIATGSVDCSACHSGETTDWTTHAQDHTTLVTQQSECSSCHTATVEYANFVDPANNVKHDDCYVCHDNTTKLASAAAGDCTQCHTANYFDSHTHSHDVSYNPSTDTSQSTQQGCATCHDDNGGALASWTDIYVEHLGNCATCHSYTDDGFGTPLQPTVETTIASGTAVTCATCHTPKVPATDHGVDHIASSYVTGEAACLVCHIDPATTFTDPANAKIHDDCTTCHDSGTNALIGSAFGNEGGPNTCTTCHTGRDWTDHNIDHQTAGYVTLHSACTSCHATTLTAGQDFINPADDEKHNACTSCHATDGAIATGSVDCSACHSGETTDWTTHAQDHTTLVTQQTECSSCHTATVEYANFVDPANNVKHDNCYVCHDNTTKLASAAAGDCTQCHTANYFDSHTHSHDVSYNPSTDTSQSTQQGCATCHDDNGGALASWTDIYVEHLGNCATCHSYTDDGFGTPLQPTVETTIASGTAVTCATCHTPKVPATDHGVDHIASSYVTGEAACLVCHIDPATTFTDPANAKIHDDCTTCHDSGTNALIGSAFGNEGGPNTCTSCHTGRDWTDHNIDHQTAGYVTLHSACTSCHATTLTAGQDFINPADDEKHNACTSCHAADGAIATGSVDCSACHSGETTDWTTHAQDHTTLVTQQTECSSCHTATVEYANFVDPANNVKHDNCYVCHDNTTKLASAAAGDCTQCHTANYFDSHTHSHDVSYNPSTDTSQSTQQGCATCHDDNGGALASWTDIYVEHLGNCATCHSYTDDGFGTPLQPTVETTIASGTAVTCATCHTPKVPATDHGVDHIASSYVTGEAACLVCHIDPATTFTDPANAKIHDDCTTCHDSGTNALIGSAAGNEGGPNTCTTCHTGRDWTDHNIDHQTAGYVTLHSACTSCHATTLTAGQDFINPADDEKHNACTSCHAADGAIATGSVDCSACHATVTGDWTNHAQDHTVLVTQATGCASCHSSTVDYAAFVDPANNVKHDDCYVCHDNTTKLASAAAGDCSQCHSGVTGDFATHTTQDHTTQVTSATGCSSCHSATVDYAAFVDPANNLKHDSCATCHNATTNAPVATAGDCSQCHAGVVGDFTTHTTQDHTTKVTLQTECSSCHTATVDYANFIDGANDKKHDSCTTCHNATTNAPVATAGDCSQCHTANYFNNHTHSHTVSVGSDQSNGQSCDDCHDVTNWGLIEGTEHNVATNGAGSCATCHNSPTQTVIDVIAAGAATTCLDCHTDKTVAHGSIDHVAATYVTVGGIDAYYPNGDATKPCATCHNTTGANSTVDITHGGNCSLCHTTVPNLQPGVPAGGGDCVTCHSSSQHNLWDRYVDSCSTSGCHATFEGGPGGAFHDSHVAGGIQGGWTDRNSATSGLTYPYSSNPEMWIANWPLTITCASCHVPFDNATPEGCGLCHSFPAKAELHLLHSAKKSPGMGISCQICH